MRTPEQLARIDPAFRWRTCDLAVPAATTAPPRYACLAALPDAARVHARASALFGADDDGVTLQLYAQIVYANPRMAELVGHGDPAELIGCSALHFYAADDRPAVFTRLRAAFFGGPAEPG